MGLSRVGYVTTLRVERTRAQIRAWRKRRELVPVADRTAQVGPGQILLFTTLRNERIRLPYFLEYYRRLGVQHVFAVDNDSNDGSREYLAEQPDCSVWRTGASYKRARYGMDWINGLLSQYANRHWALVVDPDEFFVYPYMDTRPLRALTEWLDASRRRSFGALLIDMYSDLKISENRYEEGQDPVEVLPWFDGGSSLSSTPL